MTIATEKNKKSSYRATLVRLTPARCINDDLAALGGGIYTFTFGLAPISSVYREGALLTNVANASDVNSNDEWFYDEDSGLFTIQLASAPDNDTNTIIIEYHLFYTDGDGVITYQTPTDDTTTQRFWKPRISNKINVRQSFANIVDGVFSISSSSVDIVDSDEDFLNYLMDSDSFYKKPVSAWVYINELDSVQFVFSGVSTAITKNNDAISITVEDTFSKLSKPAYMGDTSDEAYFRREANSFPNMYPPDHLKPVPFVFGRSSAAIRTISYGTSVSTGAWLHTVELGGGSTGYNDVSTIDGGLTGKAVCTSYNPTISTSYNRTWGLARTSSDFKTLTLGSPNGGTLSTKPDSIGNNSGDENFSYAPQDTTTGATTWQAWSATYTTWNHNLEVGDSFKQISTGYMFRVMYVSSDGLTVRGVVSDYNSGNLGYGFGSSSPATSDFQMNQAPAIMVRDSNSGQDYWLSYDTDFDYTISTTSGGNKYMEVTFFTFEAGIINGERVHPNMTTLHPSTHEVYFRVSQENTSDEHRHDNVMKAIIEASGMTVNAASFSAAGTGRELDCQFTIPMMGEEDFSDYLIYCQAVMQSALTYLAQNNSDEITYNLLEAPGTGTVISDTSILDKESMSIEYQDIVTEIRATNPHILSEDRTLVDIKVTDNKAERLHNIKNSVELKHVLSDITPIADTILALRKNRRATFSFSVPSKLIDASLGDDITPSGLMLLGETANLKLTSIEKGAEKVNLEAQDLLGL
jgi:hypothetical protein